MNGSVRQTILFGLASGLGTIPLIYSLNVLRSPSLTAGVIVMVNLAGYVYLLCRWSQTPRRKLLFPFILVITLVILYPLETRVFVILVVVFSWIRSGICFARSGPRKLAAELVTLLAGAGYLLLWQPARPSELALVIWFFFLVQSLYFYIIDENGGTEQEVAGDTFELAYQKLERLTDD